MDQLEDNEDFYKDESDSDDTEDNLCEDEAEDENDHDGSEADVSTCSEDDSGVCVSDWLFNKLTMCCVI